MKMKTEGKNVALRKKCNFHTLYRGRWAGYANQGPFVLLIRSKRNPRDFGTSLPLICHILTGNWTVIFEKRL